MLLVLVLMIFMTVSRLLTYNVLFLFVQSARAYTQI
jgi:hypothetical protein